LRLQGDRQVGADGRERIERPVLRAVEALGEARDRDDERDAQTEPDDREDGSRAAPDKLIPQVPREEHS
jgi:hypothetical protein